MKKIGLYIMLSILIGSLCLADKLIPVQFEVSIDFDEERDFTLVMPNGYERHFYWDNGTSHSDTTFTHTIYHNLDEELWCAENSQMGEYKNISLTMIDMLDVCSGIMQGFNQTQETCKEYGEWENEAKSCRMERDIYQEKFLDEKNESAELTRDLRECRDKRDEYQETMVGLQRTNTEISTCTADLEEARSGKSSYGFFGLLIGGAVVYFYFQKKYAPTTPSEQEEVQSLSDATPTAPEAGPPEFKEGQESR